MCSTAQTDHRPLAVTMGCPAGIGPEILCRLFSRADTLQGGPAIVVGDPGMLRRAAEHLGLALEPVNWQPGDPVRPGTLPVFRTCPLDSRAVTWGRPDAATGRAMAGLLAPPAQRAEFYGLWTFATRLASIIGPLTYGASTWATGANERRW